jgi:hypothetical protein
MLVVRRFRVTLLLLQVLLDHLDVVVDLVQLLDDLLLQRRVLARAAVMGGRTRVMRVRMERGTRLVDGVQQTGDHLGRLVRRRAGMMVRTRMLMVGTRMLVVRTRMLVVGTRVLMVRGNANSRERGRDGRRN